MAETIDSLYDINIGLENLPDEEKNDFFANFNFLFSKIKMKMIVLIKKTALACAVLIWIIWMDFLNNGFWAN